MELNVVNLARRADRKAQFTAWNQRPGLTLNFIPAVDGKTLARDTLLQEGVIAADHDRIKPGAVGNALSHRALWRKAIDTKQPVIICEDDACLRADFVQTLPAVVAKLPRTWDALFLGFNTNASIAVETGEGLKTIMMFDESHAQSPGFFDRFAKSPASLAPSTLLRVFQRWGTMCYAVSPSGAEKLSRFCFPITGAVEIMMFGQNRLLKPYGMDSMINLALQRHSVDAYCVYPPLAMAENVAADSDVMR